MQVVSYIIIGRPSRVLTINTFPWLLNDMPLHCHSDDITSTFTTTIPFKKTSVCILSFTSGKASPWGKWQNSCWCSGKLILVSYFIQNIAIPCLCRVSVVGAISLPEGGTGDGPGSLLAQLDFSCRLLALPHGQHASAVHCLGSFESQDP